MQALCGGRIYGKGPMAQRNSATGPLMAVGIGAPG